ncbi:2'-5' RNA ligase family protein [Kitasatospora sp. NBC_01250]|uniref:2'-5' RNA ligase family protein n=1 Tax=Kitasatospora sp. NBC_01250 TaxID=2903571 RepID=UPI002E335793|nr:2'-5' RNA ligase family protein [Kitasatospora sp. NBC_01250]
MTDDNSKTAELPEMTDHWWWRPGWQPGTRCYAWHLTFQSSPEVHRFAAEHRAALAEVPGLDLIPDPWLHLTMQGLGFTTEVGEDDARAVVRAAAHTLATVPAFTMTLGPAIVVPEALLLPAEPADAVRQVRGAIRAAIAHVRPEVPESADGFHPHVSVAYSNAVGPAAPALRALEPLADRRAVVRVAGAELIVLHRDRRMYEWETFASVPLGSVPLGRP